MACPLAKTPVGCPPAPSMYRVQCFCFRAPGALAQRPLPSPPGATATAAADCLAHLATVATLFTPPPACFDAQCQSSKDAVFVASLAGPLLGFVAAAALALRRRPPPADAGASFEDPDTGVAFEAAPGAEPARDRFGELAFRPVSYTPWPVEDAAAAGGEAVRIGVGPVGATAPRTFIFDKVLPPPSRLVVVTLPRPLGVVFEEERRKGRAVVAAIAPGGSAEQRCRRAALDPGMAGSAPAPDDVLRACTATNVVYPTASLILGAQPPERHIVVYGADGQRWPQVATALKRGLVADGDVTLVLERRETGEGGVLRSPLI